MGYRYRPLDPRPRTYRNNRRFPLILLLSIFLIAFGSFYACGWILWRANTLGRECRPLSPEAAAAAEKMLEVKVGIVSFAEKRKRGRRNFEGLMETVSGNKIAYAEKKGYDFIDASEMIDKRRPASWSKVIAVKTHLPNYDWVFWNDADTLVTNSTVSLEEILVSATGTWDFDNSPDLILTEDFTGVNAGVFFVRRSKWSFDFLNTWWNQTSFVRFGSSKSGDNDALKYLIHRLPAEELREHVRIAPMQCLFNSYPWNPTWKAVLRFLSSPSTIWKGVYSEGDFMVHLAGLDEKKEWVARILEDLNDDFQQ